MPAGGAVGAASTFDALFTAGFSTVDPGQPHDQTIRHGSGAPLTAAASLPHLTIGEPGEGEGDAGGPDLRLRAVLGEGGMGVVHLAHQQSLGRDVAVKRLRPGAGAGAGDALLREGRYMGGLEHPNILPVHALGRDALGRPALVMKKIEGVAWRALVRDPGHPGWARLAGEGPVAAHLRILLDVCGAVHFAHTRGVLHRDLKPENVMIGELGEVYVLDWGIAARLADGRAETGGVVGTPAYMAPEMLARGEAIDARTDVYLLGACLHEALTGEPRHQGRDLAAVIGAALRSEPVAYGPEVPPELAAICNRACAADPDERFPTALALRQALVEHLAHRASVRATERAEARAREMAAETGARAAERFAEARFGFRAALDEWPENARAREGLGALLAARARADLAHHNLDEAAALLEELRGLGADVEALEAELGAVHREDERTAALLADMDLTVGRGHRVVTTAALGFVGLGLSLAVAVAVRWFAWTPNHPDLMRLALVLNGAIWLGMLGGRRWFPWNEVNRRIARLTLLGGAVPLLDRSVGWMMGADPPWVLAADFIGAGVVMAAGAVTIAGPWLWVLSLCWIGGGYLVALAPERAADVVLIVPIASSVPAGMVWLWQRPRIEATPSG